MRQNGKWPDDELEWLDQQLKDPSIKGLIKFAILPKKNNNYGNATNELVKRYKTMFPAPRRGESDQEWAERQRKDAKQKHRTREQPLIRREAESEESHQERTNDAALKTMFSNMLSQHYTVAPARNGKKKGGERPMPALALMPRRKRRRRGGLDQFQGSDEAPARGSLSLGQWRSACHAAWIRLDEATRQRYIDLAEEHNAQTATDEAADDLAGEGDGVYTFDDICGYLDNALEVVYIKAQWATFACAAGVDENGQPDIYMTHQGQNVYGKSLLDAICAAAGWTFHEFGLIIALWNSQRSQGMSTDVRHTEHDAGHFHDAVKHLLAGSRSDTPATSDSRSTSDVPSALPASSATAPATPSRRSKPKAKRSPLRPTSHPGPILHSTPDEHIDPALRGAAAARTVVAATLPTLDQPVQPPAPPPHATPSPPMMAEEVSQRVSTGHVPEDAATPLPSSSTALQIGRPRTLDLGGSPQADTEAAPPSPFMNESADDLSLDRRTGNQMYVTNAASENIAAQSDGLAENDAEIVTETPTPAATIPNASGIAHHQALSGGPSDTASTPVDAMDVPGEPDTVEQGTSLSAGKKKRKSALRGTSGVPMPSGESGSLAQTRPRRDVQFNWANRDRTVRTLAEQRALPTRGEKRGGEDEGEEPQSSAKRQKGKAKA
ncbi:hypothetical protein OH77DRAFT_1594340 [Trametes cingulata]|nr:hypothetical protein OH77DRAFT_1594340 [Trametes cingulata]